ncbi:AMP-binding enzyme [Nocardia rhizosphaerihabitans]|uniref:AMP-binding enzyme n=1 Tax=Nocardia rhizosphaerihabitans TaxID=1691570 RepID=UPI0016650C1A
MIKRAGQNVASAEVEAVLNDRPGVFEAAVIGVPDRIRDEAIKPYVVLNPHRTDCGRIAPPVQRAPSQVPGPRFDRIHRSAATHFGRQGSEAHSARADCASDREAGWHRETLGPGAGATSARASGLPAAQYRVRPPALGHHSRGR